MPVGSTHPGNDDVAIRLSGPPQARVEEDWIDLPVDLGTAILFHLAIRGTWCARSELAALFWPDSPDAEGFRKLRQHLLRLKTFSWSPGLQIERDRLRWAPDTDLRAFDRAWETDDLRGALEHYHGPLLAGMRVDATPGFEEWLRAERHVRHDRWRMAAFRVVDEHLDSAVSPADVDLMSAVRSADPFDEAALRRELQVLAALGDRDAARRAFERFAAWLADQAGVAPEQETKELAEAIHERESVATVARSAPPATGMPMPPFEGPIVGRSELLAALTNQLRDDRGLRLVTLWGPGGVGKTHLAVELARSWLVGSAGRSLFVSLEHAHDARELFRGIAEAIHPADDSVAAIGRALDERVGLLILDNLEQVAHAGQALSQLVSRTENVTIVATSRRILGDALGLTVRVPRLAVRSSGPGDDSEAPRRGRARVLGPAETLFVQRAERRYADIRDVWHDDSEAREAVERIVHLTGGLPLALVLAAGWTHAMSLPDVARQLERSLSAWRSEATDVRERHRSIEVVLEASWRMLSSEDRKHLPGLSVFRGGFDRSAADAVIGADARRLRVWIDTSWIELHAGRYHLHPLARRFLAARLDPEKRLRIERHHAHHYAALVESQGAALIGPGAEAATRVLMAERHNIRACWQRAAQQGWSEEIARSAHGLYEFLDIVRAHPERTELLQAAVQGLEEHAEGKIGARIARRRCRIMLLSSHNECDDLVRNLPNSQDDGRFYLDEALAHSRASRLEPGLEAARNRWELAAEIYRRHARWGLQGAAALRFAERLERERRNREQVKVLEEAEALFDLASSGDHATAARLRRARALGALGEERAMRLELANCRAGIRNSHEVVRRYLYAEWLVSHLVLALEQGRGHRARRLLPHFRRALASIGAPPHETTIGEARIAEIERDWNRALALWRRMMRQSDVDAVAVSLGVARCRVALGHVDAAAMAIGNAREATGDTHEPTLIELARWLAAKGDADAAARIASALCDHADRIEFAPLKHRAQHLLQGLEAIVRTPSGLRVPPLTVDRVAAHGWRRFAEVSGQGPNGRERSDPTGDLRATE